MGDNVINIELIENTNMNSRHKIFSMAGWIESKESFRSSFDGTIGREEIKYKINGKVLKISCAENQYISVPPITRNLIQSTGSSSSNSRIQEVEVHRGKPKTLYIDLSEQLTDLTDYEGASRYYLIYIINDQNYSIEKYQLAVVMEYNNLGLLNNPEYIIDFNLYLEKINDKNIAADAISFGMLAIVIYYCIQIYLGEILTTSWKEFIYSSLDVINIPGLLVFSTFIAQTVFRYKYVRNSKLKLLVNNMKIVLKNIVKFKKPKIRTSNFTERAVKKRIIKAFIETQKKNKY